VSTELLQFLVCPPSIESVIVKGQTLSFQMAQDNGALNAGQAEGCMKGGIVLTPGTPETIAIIMAAISLTTNRQSHHKKTAAFGKTGRR
jgi:hypothetical protein